MPPPTAANMLGPTTMHPPITAANMLNFIEYTNMNEDEIRSLIEMLSDQQLRRYVYLKLASIVFVMSSVLRAWDLSAEI